MKKKICSLILAMLFAFTCSISIASTTYATSTKTKAKTKLKKVESQLKDKRSTLDDTSDTASSLTDQIKKYDSQMNKLEDKIDNNQTKKANIESKLRQYQEQLKQAKEERKKYQDLLATRLEAMYMYGNTGYLDIIFSSSSFSDFFANLATVQSLVKYDQSIIAKLENAEAKVQEKTNLVADQKKDIEKVIAELKTNQDDLTSVRSKKAQQLSSVKGNIKSLNSEISKLESEQNRLSNKINSLSSSSTSSYYGNSGALAWPVPGRYYVTSEQGYRYHPISGVYKYHAGMDIGLNYGDRVIAPASGRITVAGWYGGYGYAVGIDCGKIRGKHVTILLGHNSRVKVNVGQYVSRGQTVAYGGSTGYSTGPHCHFEVHANGSTQNPRKWLK